MLQHQIDAMNQMVDYDMPDDHDSAYDSESLIGDDTLTLASYITDYRFENGRRYHAYRDGAYWVSQPSILRGGELSSNAVSLTGSQ